MTRFYIQKLIPVFAAGLMMFAGATIAEVPPDYTVTTTGTIESINYFDNTLILDDAIYGIDKDVVVKNAKGKPVKLRAVYRGKRVRMTVLWKGSGMSKPMIQEIDILH